MAGGGWWQFGADGLSKSRLEAKLTPLPHMGQVFRRRRDIGPILYHRSPNPQAEHRGPQGGDFRLSECQEANSVLEAHDWNLPQRRHGDRLAVCWTRCPFISHESQSLQTSSPFYRRGDGGPGRSGHALRSHRLHPEPWDPRPRPSWLNRAVS